MEQYTRQLNRISKAINEILYEHIYVEIQTETDKFILDKWESISEASQKLNIHLSNIAQCCQGYRKTAGGYIWRYEEAE